MTLKSEEVHKETYYIHDLVVKAEAYLKNSGYVVVDTIGYDQENPLIIEWGVKYMKGDRIVWLNRFTAETIVSLYETIL